MTSIKDFEILNTLGTQILISRLRCLLNSI